MTPRRLVATLLVILVALLAGLSASCDWSKRTVVDMGLIDSPAPAPLVEKIVCDGSRGSTCAASMLALVLTPALTAAASRPGSIVRLWMQGSTVERTRIVWTATSVKPQRSGRRAVQDEESRWVAKSLRDAVLAAGPSLGCLRGSLADRGDPNPRVFGDRTAGRRTLGRGRERRPEGFGLRTSSAGVASCMWVCAVSSEQSRAVATSLAGIHIRMCFLDLAPVDGAGIP
jgi:hypothetical protein